MKKAFSIIKNIIVWLIVLFAVGVLLFTIVFVNTLEQNQRNIFGYRFFIVQSDSMSATDFDAGDIIFAKEVDPATLQPGDIIAFTSENEEYYGTTVTHEIRKLTVDENGEPGFITFGTTNNIDDEAIVTYQNVLGKYTGRLPNMGTFFAFLRTVPGYILCILTPFLLLIAYYGVKCVRLFRLYKREQAEEIQAENNELAEERRRSEEMKKELEALRSQISQGESGEKS